MTKPVLICPSILAADFSRLGEETVAVIDAGADWIHLDVMDGHFVPNISFGADIIKALRKKTSAFFDVHLMIQPVDCFLGAFAEAGADLITIHAESGPHIHRSVQAIKNLGKKAGLALNPATPLNVVEHLLDDLDLILIMSVNPGFGGQKFIPSMLDKINQTRALIGSRPIDLQVDGGINEGNIAQIAQAGANAFVAGSAISSNGNKEIYKKRIQMLRQACEIALR